MWEKVHKFNIKTIFFQAKNGDFERLLKIYRLYAQKTSRFVVKIGEKNEARLTFYQKSNIIVFAGVSPCNNLRFSILSYLKKLWRKELWQVKRF